MPAPSPRLCSGDGPRAVEQGLVAEVLAACASRSAASALGTPLRVLVPSQSLRAHLEAVLLSRAGRALLGLRVQTLEGAARELLERAGEAPVDARLCGIAVRGFARREPALASLDALDDGYAAASASVDDLLDAGFTPDHIAPLLDALDELSGGEIAARAAALVQTAGATAEELARGRLGHRSALWLRAAECLRDAGARALPTRHLWIHGFADATGVQLDWLDALCASFETTLWLDRPAGGEWRFGAALRERLGPAWPSDLSGSPAARVERSVHPDRECEVQAAARWARDQIEAGVAPERVGLVARDLSHHRLALRRQLARLGVPFSGAEERVAGPLARRLEASWALLERGGALPAERWLDARADLSLGERADLRDACHALGAARLAELGDLTDATLDGGARLDAPLDHAADPERGPRVRRRRVDGARLRKLRERARETLRRLEGWPAEAPLARRLADLERLGETLGWRADGPEREAVAQAFAEPERAGDRPVPAADWPRLLRRSLNSAGSEPLGGSGGGVQVLGVMEARAHSFDALWILGLERGVFPRRVSEDPLLPDELRRGLRAVLPDLPVKGEGHEEERFLFAQLLAAAPQVRVSRAQLDERGRPALASPLFESLETPLEEEGAPPWGRLDSPAALGAALEAARRDAGLEARDCEPAARARLAAQGELEARRAGLGPYLGVVGPVRGDCDPRRAALHVSRLQNTAHCPWQTFLQSWLGLAPAPDARGPLPMASDARLLGNVVHAALEALCDPQREDSPWPEAAPQEWIEAAAIESLDEGRSPAMRGYALVLAQRARSFVEVARRLDLADPWRVRGVEVHHEVSVADGSGRPRPLRFRADREEQREGIGRLSDWKTGAVKIDQKKPDTRAEKLRQLVARGELLQGHAYALANAAGRYVYLKPDADIDDALRVVEVESEGPQREAFDTAVAALLDAIDAGAFFPRLREPGLDEEPGRCRTCEVKPACLRGDSGARRRLSDWAEAEPTGPLERAAHALWTLGEPT